MSQGDVLAAALGATMALLLALRALRTSRLSWTAKAGMALAWLVLIGAGSWIAAWWRP